MRQTATRPPHLSYIAELYAPEDALLREIRAVLAAHDRAIHIGPEEGRLLQLLIRLHGSRTVLEIGTLAGYSALWIARALPEGGQLVTLEKDPEMAALAGQFIDRAGLENRIEVIEGDAAETLPGLTKRAPFDAVFIDADKPSYPLYLDWAERLLRPGGMLIADNTLLFGSVYQDTPPPGIAPSTWRRMRDFNARLADRERYDTVMIPTAEGLTVAVRR